MSSPHPSEHPHANEASPSTKRRGPIVALASVAIAIALGAAIAVGYALAGGGGDNAQPVAAQSSAVPELPPAVQVECANVERAYNAWNGTGSIKSAADAAALNEVTVMSAVDDGKAFFTAVEGYKDQPALTLAAAIAAYNFEVGLINMSLTLSGRIVDSAQPAKVAAEAEKVRQAYASFKTTTCSA